MCDLLRALPGWEAIKTTRGHYRSCGKDPHACCVSHLLQNKPVVQSGRDLTYSPGKDTGRYWDAGATNVHWVIATNAQVDDGIKQAIGRVRAPGVLVEGNSFTQYVDPDFFIVVARPDNLKIKPTVRRALSRLSAAYLSSETDNGDAGDRQGVSEFIGKSNGKTDRQPLIFTRSQLPQLISLLRGLSPTTAL